MERKYITILFACATSMSLVLVALYASSPLNEQLYRGNFQRNFGQRLALTKLASTAIEGHGDHYISGVTDDSIYISSYKKPFQVQVFDVDLKLTQNIGIKLLNIDSLKEPRQFRTKIVPPNFYIINGVIPIIMKGNTKNWQAREFSPDGERHYFDEMVPINETNLILRSYSTRHQQSDLARLTSHEDPNFKFNFDLLKKQLDGLIDVSGHLHYNEKINRIVYLYSYRNEFFTTDTSLNNIISMNTIDTFKIAQLKVSSIQSQGTSMVEGSSAITNIRSACSDKFLFVHSNLLANNEDEMTFIQSSTIDVYNLEDGKYISSFYIPNYKNSKLVDFKVAGTKIIALFNSDLVVYNLNKDILTDKKQSITSTNRRY